MGQEQASCGSADRSDRLRFGVATDTQSTRSSSQAGRINAVAGLDSAFTDRVRLYLKVTFLINLFLHVGSSVLWLVGIDDRPQQTAIMVQMSIVTVVNGAVWAIVARVRPTFIAAILIQALVTLALNANYIWITVGRSGQTDVAAPVFALLIVTIVLVLRSSLVPSPTFGTAIVGALSIIVLVIMTTQSSIENSATLSIWLAMFGVVVVVITSLASKTIYGLQVRVQAARKLGQYELQDKVGSGGMGDVFLAKHALLNRPTAIKLLKDASNTSSRDRFRQEVQIASGLTHPNTVEIYDYGRTPDGVFYFAMEFVEGATLDAIVRTTGPMPAKRVVQLLLQAAGSLSEAHHRGLVHRDIKPSNLMICERGGAFDTLKVLDFGLVHDLSDTEHRNPRTLAGTPLYLAPEVILDDASFAPESDIYALGATAYFLITGKPPFWEGDLANILSDHLATPPTVPQSEDAVLVELILRCLSKDPSDRPSDAVALGEALEGCQSWGEWKNGDARVWWSEHREIVASAGQQEVERTTTASVRC